MNTLLFSIEKQNELFDLVTDRNRSMQQNLKLLGSQFKKQEDFVMLETEYKNMIEDIFHLWDFYYDCTKSTNPFTVIHNSNGVHLLRKSISKYINDPNYYTVILYTLGKYAILNRDIPVNYEYVMTLKERYL